MATQTEIDETRDAVERGFAVLDDCKRAVKGRRPKTPAETETFSRFQGLGDIFNGFFGGDRT